MLTQSNITGCVSSRAGRGSASGRLCHTISSIAVLRGGRGGGTTFGDADAALAAASATWSSLPARPRSRESHAQTLLHGCDGSLEDLGGDGCGLANIASISQRRKKRRNKWNGRTEGDKDEYGTEQARRKFPGLDAYLTAFIWGRSRQPRLAGRFEGCATPWSGPGCRSASDYAGVPRRYIPSLGPWDGAERQPLAPSLLEASKSVQLSILVAMASLGGSSRHNHIPGLGHVHLYDHT